jgi:hypothetical protein
MLNRYVLDDTTTRLTAVAKVRSLLWLGTAFVALSCVRPRTQVLVVIETDAPNERMMTIAVRLARDPQSPVGMLPALRIQRGGALGEPGAPSFGILRPPDQMQDSRVTVSFDAYLESLGDRTPAAAWQRTVRFSFVPQRTQMLRVFLSLQCGVRALGCSSVPADLCTVAQRCIEQQLSCGRDGVCEPIDQELEPLDASVPFVVDATAVADTSHDVDTHEVAVDGGDGALRDDADAVAPVMDGLSTDIGVVRDGVSFGEAGTYQMTVPAEVSVLRARLWGAGGGAAEVSQNFGGPGGYAEAIFGVTAGQQLAITVGGPGGFGAVMGSGGMPGSGGAGGSNIGVASDKGGGGGGFTELVWPGGYLIAGGGGGATWQAQSRPESRGGAGGGLTGARGGVSTMQGGTGGTQTDAGMGGAGSVRGGAGNGRVGGTGANGGFDPAGGGGGGGLFGGGGGSSSNRFASGPGGGGGGSGGSSIPSAILQRGTQSDAGPPDPARGAAGDPGIPGRVVLVW